MGTATRTIFQIRRIWLLLSWIRRMNRAFLFFFVSLPFLSFLFRFFHTTRFLFASVHYQSVATALRPPYTCHSIVTPPKDGLSHTNQGRRPSCSFAHLSSAMASSWLYPFHIFHTAMTITIFLAAHLGDFRLWCPILLHFPFLRNTPRLEG